MFCHRPLRFPGFLIQLLQESVLDTQLPISPPLKNRQQCKPLADSAVTAANPNSLCPRSTHSAGSALWTPPHLAPAPTPLWLSEVTQSSSPLQNCSPRHPLLTSHSPSSQSPQSVLPPLLCFKFPLLYADPNTAHSTCPDLGSSLHPSPASSQTPGSVPFIDHTPSARTTWFTVNGYGCFAVCGPCLLTFQSTRGSWDFTTVLRGQHKYLCRMTFSWAVWAVLVQEYLPLYSSLTGTSCIPTSLPPLNTVHP